MKKNKVSCTIATCSDALNHGFKELDDGTDFRNTLCGQQKLEIVKHNEHGLMCTECIPLIAVELGLDPKIFEDEKE